MHYTFKSKAAGDLLMMEPVGSELLRVIGQEPAPQGIIEAAAMPSAIEAIERAIAREEAQPLQAVAEAATESTESSRDEAVTLRQRAWPLVEMMKRAQLENANIAERPSEFMPSRFRRDALSFPDLERSTRRFAQRLRQHKSAR